MASAVDDIDESWCTKCKKNTQVVHDYSAGDTICSECGLVLEAYSVDETCEGRIFPVDCYSFESHRDHVSDPLLTTIISQEPDSDQTLSDWWKESPNPNQTLIEGFETIGTMCGKLDLVATVRIRAKEIYKKTQDGNTFKGSKINEDAILGACVYIACAEEHKPRTLKEICSVANGASQKEIALAKKKIAKQEMGSKAVEFGSIHASDFVVRFCSPLCLKFRTVKAAQEAAKKWEQLDIRKNPASVAAAVIYMIIQLSSDDKRYLHEISTATGIAEGTISKACRDMYPYVSTLIPRWYAQEKDLNNLTILIHNLKIVD